MFITDLFENEDDMFAGSQRVQHQVERDRHPLNQYLDFDDYDHLMDEFEDTRSAINTEAELDAYLEKFESGLKSVAIPQVVVDIIEEFAHGRYGKYGIDIPRRNELLHADLNKAFSQIWMDYKPDRFVKTLMRHMAHACVAAIHAEDEYDGFNESADDDMFAPSKVERIANAIDKLADIFTRHKHSEQSVHYCRNLANTFRTQGIDRGVWAWYQTRPGNSDFAGGASQTVQIYVQKETGFDITDRYLDLNPKKMRGEYDLDESDDMFATSERTSKVPAAIIVGDGEFLSQTKIKNRIIAYAKEHGLKIFGAVPDAWRLEIYFRTPTVDDIYPLVLELEELAGNDWIVTLLHGTWDVKTNKPFINESEDDMFAKRPIEQFVDGLKAYVKTEEGYLAQEHPTWADHPDTVNKKRIIARVNILIDQLSNPTTREHGFNQLVAYINSPVSGHLGWIYDIEEFLADNKFPTMESIIERHLMSRRKDVDEDDDMFSTASRQWTSFDDLFADQLDLGEDKRDDIAGWLYDFNTPVALAMINELVGGYVTVTDAYFDDARDDWFFKYK